MSPEIIRQVIFIVTGTVLILRTPFMVRHKQQRPLWLLIVVIASGSIVIQSWFGTVINRSTGIAQFNNLFQGVFAVLDIAASLEFVIHLASGKARSRAGRVARIAWPLATVAGMALSFALTPAAERFKPLVASGPFLGYVLLVGAYLIGGAGAATWVMWRHLPQVVGRTLYTALLMVMIGNAAEVPFMAIRTLQRWTDFATPRLAQAALGFSTARFILLPLGCIVVAIEPARKTILYCYRRARLYSLWHLLRSATKGIVLNPLVSRRQDLLSIDHPWERLHRRVIEIRDSIFYLHDNWAWAGLLEQAAHEAEVAARVSGSHLVMIDFWLKVARRTGRQAERGDQQTSDNFRQNPGTDGRAGVWLELLVIARWGAEDLARSEQRQIIAMACWIEVTRRAALSSAPKLHRQLDHELLPELQTVQSTMRAEMRYLVRLGRAMRLRRVQAFAEEITQAQREGSGS